MSVISEVSRDSRGAVLDEPATPPERVAKATPRLGHIEAIRGLACLMVVAYHVIGNDPAHGMRMPEGGTWWAVPRVLDAMQMPLFAFVSGWVFSITTGDLGRFRAALGRKLMRLALPMASVSVLYLSLATAVGKADGRTVLDVLFLPYQHLWYLQASLWLIGAAALGALAFGGRMLVFAGFASAASLLLFLPAPHFTVDLLSVGQAIYLAPFFFAGLLTRTADLESAARATNARFAATLGVLVVVGIASAVMTRMAFTTAGPGETWIQTAPAFVFATTLALGLLLMRPRSDVLEAIGTRSFTIYLFHVFFTAPTREVVTRLWPGIPNLLLFAVIFGAGVALPFALHGLLVRNRWSALVLLGRAEAGGRR